MNMTGNIHSHCNRCDGENSAEEMVIEAIRLGFNHIGFSSHSPAPFDSGCAGIKDEEAYRLEINALKEKYHSEITVLCGVEQDYYGPVDMDKYEYIIGSVHYIKHSDIYYIVDLFDDCEKLVKDIYKGDWYKMAEDFFGLSYENVKKYKPTVVGHYDLVKKFNMMNRRFDENSEKYKKPALDCLDEIIDICSGYGGLFEVNLGAVGRGYRNDPYPSRFILEHLSMRNAPVIITTDSHNVKSLSGGWEIGLSAVKAAGFKEIFTFTNGKISPLKLE